MPKVLILCPYSHPSACGVWMRVVSDAKTLQKNGFEVHVFSSNVIKGTNLKSEKYELWQGIHIHRFRSLFSFGGGSMFWFFTFSFFRLKPQIVHTHLYRHPHSLIACLLSKLSGKKVFLTTHAPFEKDPTRSVVLKLFDFFYDLLIGWWELKLYTKIIRITDWEVKYLKKLLVNISKTVLITNGINQLFLGNKPEVVNKLQSSVSSPAQVLYMGRLDPVKRLEWMVEVAKVLPQYKFKIWGPLSGYPKFESQSSNLDVITEKFTPEEFINELAKASIFVLTSTHEGLSLVTLEAMSQGVIPIVGPASGPKEFIKDGWNGFVVNSQKELKTKIKYVYDNLSKLTNVRINAINTASEYSELKVGAKLVDLYKSELAKV